MQRRCTFVPPVILIGLLLANCTQVAAPPSAPRPAATEASRQAPTEKASHPGLPTPTPKPPTEKSRYGGVVTRIMNRDVASYDLQREQQADASVTLFNIYEGLVRLHPTEHEKIVRELAESWEISPDGKVFTFKFQKDIQWHDGKPFTMGDVKYSLDRMQNPKAFKTIAPRAEGLLAAMEKAEIAGEDTIRVTLKYPSASFLPNIATGWVAIEPQHIIVAKGDLRKDAVGTGAFKLKEHNADISFEVEKNPNYHVKGLPYLDGVKLYVIKDGATRFSAFRTGKCKVTFSGTNGLSPLQADVVRREMADKAIVYDHDAQSRYSVSFNLERKPWDDVRVRKAVDLAFDRQAAIKVSGKGYIGSIYVAPWGMKAEELEKLPGYRQPKDADIAEARRLLAEAGYPNGFKTTLTALPGGAQEQQAVMVKNELAKVSIDVELALSEATTITDRLTRRSFDLAQRAWLDNTGDPDETLFTYYATGGSRNFGAFSNKEIDELIDRQSRTMDKEARKAILGQIERKIMELVPMVITFWDVYQTGAWKEVKNFSPGPGIHPWGKFDYMWLEK